MPYRLDWPARLLFSSLYLLAVCAWLFPQTGSLWLAAFQWALAAGFGACAMGWLAFPTWRRLPQLSAWLALISLPLALIMLFAAPLYSLAMLLPGSPLLFLLTGWTSFHRQSASPGPDRGRCSWLLALKIAFDEAMLGYFVSTTRNPSRRRIRGIAAEVQRAVETLERHGWLQQQADFHQDMHAPEVFELEDLQAMGHRYQSLQFPSAYVSHTELPGAERWETYGATHTVHVRLFEHAGAPRPWLMCIHGYRMGWPYLDFQLFSPGWLHHKLGFNLIMPLLPLHGLRKVGLRSGDGYFDGELLDLLHAEAEAVADLRSCLRWLREQREVPGLGVYGVSLGGLNASLLGCLESDIDSLIAAIPLVDPARVFELNAPDRMMRSLRRHGVGMKEVQALLTPVSPLRMTCRVAPQARAIVAGQHDKIVPLPPIAELQKHWDDCPLYWYSGSHLSIRREADVRAWLQDTWKSHGMLAGGVQ